MLITGFIYTFIWITLVTANCYTRTITLNDGNKIPSIGFGTFGKISDIESMGPAVVTAIEAGYRLIDTAYIYLNEEVVGDAISNVTRRGIVKRRDLFITSKLSILSGPDEVVSSLKKSLTKLKLDYIDLYLIHFSRNQPTRDDYPYVDIWKGMEVALMLGLTKSIGVSNFNSSNINKILSNCKIRPAVNQIEVNPTMANMGLVSYCQSQNIQVMSYAPFGFAVPRPFNNKTLAPSFDDPTLVEIANKYGKSTSQVFLRYLDVTNRLPCLSTEADFHVGDFEKTAPHRKFFEVSFLRCPTKGVQKTNEKIDRATIPIPRSTNKEHIRSNIDVFNFHLTRQEVYKISEFDNNTAVYLQNGLYFPHKLFTYIYGTTLEEIAGSPISA